MGKAYLLAAAHRINSMAAQRCIAHGMAPCRARRKISPLSHILLRHGAAAINVHRAGAARRCACLAATLALLRLARGA